METVEFPITFSRYCLWHSLGVPVYERKNFCHRIREVMAVCKIGFVSVTNWICKKLIAHSSRIEHIKTYEKRIWPERKENMSLEYLLKNLSYSTWFPLKHYPFPFIIHSNGLNYIVQGLLQIPVKFPPISSSGELCLTYNEANVQTQGRHFCWKLHIEIL